MAEKQTTKVQLAAPGGKADNNTGILNPWGISWGITALAYLGLMPVTDYVARTETLQYVLTQTVALLPGCAAAVQSGSSDRVMIPALSALYLFATYGASGALSVAGQAMARAEGRLDPSHPRRFVGDLEGLPLRLRSAHYGLLENFPAFALAAALAQSLSPGDPHLVGLLGLHVLSKVGVFYPAYLADVPAARSAAHLLANAAAINVCWKLAAAGAAEGAAGAAAA